MNKVFLQIWEESMNDNIQPDGASIHLTKSDVERFVSSIYKERTKNVPESYTRIVGDSSEVLVSDSLYEILTKKKSIKLEEYEFNNLVGLNDIRNAE